MDGTQRRELKKKFNDLALHQRKILVNGKVIIPTWISKITKQGAELKSFGINPIILSWDQVEKAVQAGGFDFITQPAGGNPCP